MNLEKTTLGYLVNEEFTNTKDLLNSLKSGIGKIGKQPTLIKPEDEFEVVEDYYDHSINKHMSLLKMGEHYIVIPKLPVTVNESIELFNWEDFSSSFPSLQNDPSFNSLPLFFNDGGKIEIENNSVNIIDGNSILNNEEEVVEKLERKILSSLNESFIDKDNIFSLMNSHEIISFLEFENENKELINESICQVINECNKNNIFPRIEYNGNYVLVTTNEDYRKIVKSNPMINMIFESKIIVPLDENFMTLDAIPNTVNNSPGIINSNLKKNKEYKIYYK